MENLNLVELLKDCPKGMELDSTVFDNMTFDYVNTEQNRIYCKIDNRDTVWFTAKGCINLAPSAKCAIFPKGKNTWGGFVPPCKFKDGDVCCIKTEEFEHIFIFKVSEDYNYILKYANLSENNLYTDKNPVCTTDCVKEVRLATEEEKQKLFDAIKANGYKWNAVTKTLEKLIEPKFKVGDRIQQHKARDRKDNIYTITKIDDVRYHIEGCPHCYTLPIATQDHYILVPNKFDITTLKAFDKVLVRNTNSEVWRISLFGCFSNEERYFMCMANSAFYQCIPYNEDTKHLVGTADDCDDFYKTWKNNN